MTFTAKGELSPMKTAFLTYAKAPLLGGEGTSRVFLAAGSCRGWSRFGLNLKSYI